MNKFKFPFASDLKNILLIGFLVGLVPMLYFFSLDYMSGNASRFLYPRGDNQAYSTAQLLFENSKFYTWPLFSTDRLIRDDLQSLVYSDFVPFMAIIIKVINNIFNIHLNHLIIWTMVIFPLQAMSFAFLLISLGIKDKYIIFVGSLFSIFIPSFLYRIGHLPLLGHFVINLSLGFYFYERYFLNKLSFNKKLFIFWTFLISITILINLYLALMVILIYFAYLFDYSRREGFSFAFEKNNIKYFLLPIVIIYPVLYISGYLLPYQRGYDFGFHSMNLLSPFYPALSGLFDNFKNMYDPTGGQYEGYNYLGAGILLLLIIDFKLIGLNSFKNVKFHYGLIISLSILLLYSLSSKIYLGHHLLITYDAPKFLGTFRSTGRFFWPITYLVLAVSFVIIYNNSKKIISYVLISMLCIIQIFDCSHLAQGFYDSGHQVVSNEEYSHLNDFNTITKDYSGIYITPDFHCLSKDNNWLIGNLAFEFARRGKTINTFYMARMPADQNCNIEISRMLDKERQLILPIAIVESNSFPNVKNMSCIESSFNSTYICTLSSISGKVLPELKKTIYSKK